MVMYSSAHFAHCFVFLLLLLSFVSIIIFCNIDIHLHKDLVVSSSSRDQSQILAGNLENEQPRYHRRKLLVHGERCSNRDISISQSKESRTGIPEFIVEIANTCLSDDRAPSEIHVHCGWFASAKIVNPRIFKRIFYDDCLLNQGNPLKISQTIRFTYSNSFMYPLRFKSANFC